MGSWISATNSFASVVIITNDRAVKETAEHLKLVLDIIEHD